MALNKKCSKCNEIKEPTSFYAVKGKPVQPCKDCRCAYAKAWRKDNPEYYNNWAGENKDKVQRKNKNYQNKRRLAKPVVAMLLALSFLAVRPCCAMDVTCGKKLKDSAKIINVDRILDGDTSDVTILLKPEQFGVKQTFRYRLLGNDTPEKVGKSKPEGLVATAAATKWLTDNKDHLVAELYGTGKFGRALTILRSSKTNETLNEFLIKEGHHTRGTEPYCGGSRKAKPVAK